MENSSAVSQKSQAYLRDLEQPTERAVLRRTSPHNSWAPIQSQFQLASSVSEPSQKWVPQLPPEQPQLKPCRAETNHPSSGVPEFQIHKQNELMSFLSHTKKVHLWFGFHGVQQCHQVLGLCPYFDSTFFACRPVSLCLATQMQNGCSTSGFTSGRKKKHGQKARGKQEVVSMSVKYMSQKPLASISLAITVIWHLLAARDSGEECFKKLLLPRQIRLDNENGCTQQ